MPFITFDNIHGPISTRPPKIGKIFIENFSKITQSFTGKMYFSMKHLRFDSPYPIHLENLDWK
jgi:hypothetical protein